MARVTRIYGRCLVIHRQLQPGADRETELDLEIRAGKRSIGQRNREVLRKARPSRTRKMGAKAAVAALTPEEEVQMSISSVGETAKIDKRPFMDGH